MLTKETPATEVTGKEMAVETRRWFDLPFSWPLMNRWFEGFPTLASDFRVEEKVDGNEYVLRCELPGLDPDKDVELFVRDGALVVRAERKQETKTSDEDKGWYRTEFRYGSFNRTLPLPRGVTADDVKATYVDGILEVRMPYATAAPEPRKIEVTKL